MSIIYDDEFETPRFEPINLNGRDGAWDLLLEGDEEGDTVTFENADTLDQWLTAVVDAAKAVGINLPETREALR